MDQKLITGKRRLGKSCFWFSCDDNGDTKIPILKSGLVQLARGPGKATAVARLWTNPMEKAPILDATHQLLATCDN